MKELQAPQPIEFLLYETEMTIPVTSAKIIGAEQ